MTYISQWLTSQSAWLSYSHTVGQDPLSWISQNSSTDLVKDAQQFIIFEHLVYEYSWICDLWTSYSPIPPLPSCPFVFTPPNIWPHNGDIFVPVWAGLLVHKAQGVHELMGNHSKLDAVRTLKRHGLSSATSTKVGPAPGSLTTECISLLYL